MTQPVFLEIEPYTNVPDPGKTFLNVNHIVAIKPSVAGVDARGATIIYGGGDTQEFRTAHSYRELVGMIKQYTNPYNLVIHNV